MDFDPSQPSEVVELGGPSFDPTQPSEVVAPTTVGEKATHALGTLGRAAAGSIAAVPDLIARLAQATDRRLDPGSVFRSDDVQTPGRGYETAKWAQAVRDSAEKIMPRADPSLADSFWLTDVPSALGTAAAMVGGGGAVGAIARTGKTAAALVAGNFLGFAGEFDDAFDTATRAGQSPDEALARSLGYASVAMMIEYRLGAGRLLRRYFPSGEAAIQKLTAKGVTATVIKDLGAGFIEEASQRVAQNRIVGGKWSIEGAAREGAAGAVAEAALGLPGAFLHRHGRGGTQTQEPLPAAPPEAPPAPAPRVEDDFRFEPETPATPMQSTTADDERFAPPEQTPAPLPVVQAEPVAPVAPDQTSAVGAEEATPETPPPALTPQVIEPTEEEIAATPVEPVQPSPPAATITGQEVQQGTGDSDGRGLQMTNPIPAEVGGNPSSQANLSRSEKLKAYRRALDEDRPPDFLDWLANFGRIRSHRVTAKSSQSMFDSGDYQRVRQSSAGKQFIVSERNASPPDVVAQRAFEDHQISEPTPDALWAAMAAAINQRRDYWKRHGGSVAQRTREQAQQADAYSKAQRPGSKRQLIAATDLQVGDSFLLKGERVKVKEFEFDPETLDPISVTLDDGQKFGTQIVPIDQAVALDKKSLQHAGAQRANDLAPLPDWEPIYKAAKGRKVDVTVQDGDSEETVQMPADKALKRQRSLIDVLDRIRDCLR